jgi:hypothetical protein
MRIDYLGNYKYGGLIWHSAPALYTTMESICYALALTEDNYVVAVGYFSNSNAPNPKDSALLVKTDD